MSTHKDSFKTVRTEISARGVTRRHFIYTTAIAAGSLAMSAYAARRPNIKSPNEKLNIGLIGVTGKGMEDSRGLSGENIVAICDVDSNNLANGASRFAGAKQYRDYRIMIETEKELDAVTVTIPDHQHAPAAMLAMQAGRNVYCQKPLTHAVSEARALTMAARKYKVATQMGNQGHSSEDIRRLCEMIWSGVIGNVKEAHCYTNRPIWPQGRVRPTHTDPVPENLDWDLWIGPAPMRPFAKDWKPQPPAAAEASNGAGGGPGQRRRSGGNRGIYHPFAWRGWWDFGCGALGDMACHVMDGANWALALNNPTSVEVVQSSPVTADMAPDKSVLKFEFPARGDKPACTLYWHDGGNKPAKPANMEGEWGASGTLFMGEKGIIHCGEYCDRPRLLPESSMADYKRPDPTIPRVPGNSPYQDFIRACKGGPAACSNFEVSGPFTEVILLGNLALRLGKKIEWDPVNMKCKGLPEADQYINGHYRKGWTV